jgi:membrane fusion protein (multidrug efflux system)
MDIDPLTPAPVPFRSTLRSLRSLDEGEHRALTLLGLAAALAWAMWGLLGSVPLYATSAAARVEAQQSTFHIAPAVDGRIARADLALAQPVKKGDTLIELESTTERMLLEEGRAAITGLRHDITALGARAESERRAAAAEQARLALAIEEAAATEREARAQSDMATRRAAEVARLLAGGLVAESDAASVRQEADAKRARQDAARLAWQRSGKARDVSFAEAAAKQASIAAERVRLEGELTRAERRGDQLEQEVERRRVIAPVAGTVGELKNVHVGTFVAAGERLGVLVPDDTLRIVADVPGEMLAKIRPGQPARFRFEGYPALAHGSVAAVVGRVGAEARDGSVEVVLTPQPGGEGRLPLQHGVRGTVDIEIERVTPAILLLRKIGQLAEPRAGEAVR